MTSGETLIFDIGKTNKKLFLFDSGLEVKHQESRVFAEIPDDEGFPSEDLEAVSAWIMERAEDLIKDPANKIQGINFSAYGASLVHLDSKGEVIAPFYNYLKAFPDSLRESFFSKYYGETDFSLITSSPVMGFLNSGLQLYYIKYLKPDIFKKLTCSLHLPQFLSYLFTNQSASEYTSVGCHTGLWDFRQHRYASWVREEELEKYLAPIQPTSNFTRIKLYDKEVHVGSGIHDSSANLIPYTGHSSDPFLLLSTGTWSICMNMFNNEELTAEDLEKDCLNFLSIREESVKASRLFLGKEFQDQIRQLGSYFDCSIEDFKSITYNHDLATPGNGKHLQFYYRHLNPNRFGFIQPATNDYSQFANQEQAYHQLLTELTAIQVSSLKLAAGNTTIKRVYIDGGFAENEVFIQMMANKLLEFSVFASKLSYGSALGAALITTDQSLSQEQFEAAFRYYQPFV